MTDFGVRSAFAYAVSRFKRPTARAKADLRRAPPSRLGRFGSKTIGDLVAAQGRATVETLAKNGCPMRTLHADRVDEESMGKLVMHFMLETIIAGPPLPTLRSCEACAGRR